jgi:hypothetical protein
MRWFAIVAVHDSWERAVPVTAFNAFGTSLKILFEILNKEEFQ